MQFVRTGANIVAIAVFTAAASATPFDGLYAPSESFAMWSCQAEDIGADVGAVGIMKDYLQGVENACKLTNPTNVRGMDAVLYDAICSGEGEKYSHRVMLMRHDNGIYVIQDGYAAEWRSCR
ncbi:hypothetical protein EI983_04025 [Roseovarius faecimaris]|uniref:Uncharacterized protein n=1 Tax=Roseovarius faecimaris TaxID=2494550 RepID=A0A6I6IPV5_9RHOB|nr:hypothetical protein [Roseovarius faecimaris]QGX97487.1 hypothetical protein EI983_04025 [Roseovarius faecimaris]